MRATDDNGAWDVGALAYDAYDGKLEPRAAMHRLAKSYEQTIDDLNKQIAQKSKRIAELESDLAKHESPPPPSDPTLSSQC